MLDFLKTELEHFGLKLKIKQNWKEEVDFLIGNNQLYLQFIDLDTSQRSIKIKKQVIGELKDNLFVALVLIIHKEPKVFYVIPSKDLLQSKSNIFVENNVSLMPILSNWEIKVSTNKITELSKYALENMTYKFKN
ncbi:hypothetical protein [Polaribacter aestuariivivens]|uniref:hypothetical protein n=1 Tax=Polaribacter aestuariivivens TaxID=2304626 RepID=UPI003F491981